jgi:hypothetical protein
MSLAAGDDARLFRACRGVFKTSTAVAAFLLPYMVLNVIQHGNDDARREILAEILAVLDTTAHLCTPLRNNAAASATGAGASSLVPASVAVASLSSAAASNLVAGIVLFLFFFCVLLIEW